MAGCVHHWKQDPQDIQAPFTCKHCGEVRFMETDFFKLYENHYGKPWDRTESGNHPLRPAIAA